MSHRIVIILFIAGTVIVSGCSSTARKLYLPEQKDFSQIIETWPAIDPNQARLVFFSPEVNRLHIAPDDKYKTFAANMQISNDALMGRFGVEENSAVYVDVSQGDYTVQARYALQGLALSVTAGQIYYIKTVIRPDALIEDPGLVNENDAKPILNQKHFKACLPDMKPVLVPLKGKPLTAGGYTTTSPCAAGYGRLILFRSTGFSAAGTTARIGLNGAPKIELANNQYCMIEAPAGRHVLTFAYSPTLLQGFSDIYCLGIVVNIADNAKTNIGFFDLSDMSGIASITQAQADMLLKTCSPAKDGNLKYQAD